MTDLLPCPFCGGDAELIETQRFPTRAQGYCVRCIPCAAQSEIRFNAEEAIERWNARHQPLKPMYYPTEQMLQANVLAERYIKCQQDKQAAEHNFNLVFYQKEQLLAFVRDAVRALDHLDIQQNSAFHHNAKELLTEIGEA